MKKILSILMALLTVLSVMAIAVSAAVGDVAADYAPADGSVGISSLSEITDPAGTYHLTGDITVSETYAEAFSGVLDGCGHTVTVSAPMFAEFNGTIKNMVLDGSITATDSSAAAVAVTSTSSMTAMNITSNVDITVSGTAADLYAAAIVSLSTSTDVANTFMGIVNNGDITVNAPEGSKPRAAGIAARLNNAVFTDCMNNGTITMYGYQSVIGGICARANNNGGDVDFYHCVNNGNVSGAGYYAYAGGICGYAGLKGLSETYDFIGCVNTGNITASYECAGIVAYVYANANQYPVIENCINTGAITFGGNDASSNPNLVWGSPFAGFVNSVNTSIKNNIDTGSLTCTIEGFANYTFIGVSSANLAANSFANNYVTDLATKFNYLAYASSDSYSANRITIDQAGAALTDTTVDYIKSEEFINTVSGFIKTDSLPVVSSGDSWNGGEYVMAVAEHVCGGLTKVEAVAANCGTKGNIEYYTCSCGRYYKDAEANEEITDKGSVIIPVDTSIAHIWGETVYRWTYHPTTGYPNRCVASRTCSVCGEKETATGTLSGKLTAVAATCISEGKQYRTATFSVDWATESTSDPDKYIIAIDPNVHVGYSYYSVKDETHHIRKYLCCGGENEYEHNIVSGKCRLCAYVEGATEFYTITYVVDGSVYAEQKVCYLGNASTPRVTKEGYVLSQWNTKEDGTGNAFTKPYNVKGDSTYYAIWTDKATVFWYIVYPDGTRTKITPDSRVTIGNTINPKPSIAPVGYYIEGWYTNIKFTKEFDFTAPITSNASVYAKLAECTSHTWGEVAYEWTDDYSGCTAVRKCTRCNYAETDVATSVQVSVTEKATCAKTGSATGTATFASDWATDLNGKIVLAIDPDNHVSATVTYKWAKDKEGIPNKCTAALYCSACSHKESTTVTANEVLYITKPTCQNEGVAYKVARFTVDWAEEQKSAEYAVPKQPDRHALGYVYSVKDATYHTQLYPCCGVERDLEHNMSNAVCTVCGYKEGAATYVVTFVVDGKEFCKVNVCYGSRVSSPQAPAKDGCVFKNWYTEENGQGNVLNYIYNTEGDTTYYAYYTNKVQYRFLIVNLEGGLQIIIPYVEVLYGTTITAPAFSEYAEKLPEGYYIEGWYDGSSFKTEFDFSQPLTKLKTSIYGKLAELKGWCEIDGEWYYYYEDGTKAAGFARVPYNTELGHAPNADDLAYYNANKETSKYSDAENAVYYFAEDGKLIRENGIVVDGETTRYAVDGVIAWHVGMVEVDGEYYYFGGDVNGGGNVMLTGNVYATRNTTELDMVVSGVYTFAEDGKMCKYEGLTEVDGALYYYDGYCRSKSVGVVKTADGYIYVRTTNLEVITGKQYWVSVTGESGVIKGIYVIDDNGFIKDPVLVNTEATTGIFDGYYYVDGEVQYAAGAVEIDGDIYYVRANGQIVTGGQYWVTQSSELLPAGKYTFDENGKLVK